MTNGSKSNRMYVKKSLKVRKFVRDRKGVSEVLGDILLVSMSVVLVSVIAYQVTSIKTPVQSTKIDLVATIDGNNLVISHMGGEKLQEKYIKIYVGEGAIATNKYNLSDGLGGSKIFSIGQIWSKNITTTITHADLTKQPIFVQIVDTKQNAIILDQILRKGLSTSQFPDIGVDKTSMTFSLTNPENDVFISISVKVVNYGPVNVSNVNVRFFDGKTYIGANNTILSLKRAGLPNDNKTVSISWRTTYIGKHTLSVTVVPKLNETNLANNYLSKNLVVGAGINPDFILPNLIVKSLYFSKDTPKSKELVIVTAQIGNTAKITASGFKLAWGDNFEGHNTTLNTTTYVGNVTYVKDIYVKFEWTPLKGGSHMFWVNIINVTPLGEDPKANANPDLDRDYMEQRVEVLPTILLVDDDRAGKGASKDVITYMRESLGFIGLSPDVVVVSGGDGPQYTGSGITLDKYDVIIWMSGYENTNTITTSGPTNDVMNLQKYLDSNGSLWLIGQDIVNDLKNNGGAAGNSFLSNYLRVNIGGSTLDVGISNPILGNSGCKFTKGLNFKTAVATGLPNKADVIALNGAVSAMDNKTHKNMSLLTNQSTRGNAKGYKVAFFAFEFAQIQYSSDRAILAYEVMTWFNATVTIQGDDLAISEVSITPNSPHYKQEVLIKATIRSNGLKDLKGVRVIFKDVFNGIEKVMDPVAVSDAKRAPNPLTDSPDTNNPMSIDILGKGGMNVTYKYWTPDKIGTHYIKVVVDPNDVIKEFNEDNNEFVSELNPTNVFVDAITLVVDDDQQTIGALNATSSVVSSLNFLGYKYETFTVNAASQFNGPGVDKLTRYNSVIWVLGNEKVNTLKKEDTTNLSSYLKNYDDSKLFIIGQNLVNDANLWNNLTFRRALLGISGKTGDAGTPPILYGIKNNNITHGMQYPTTVTFTDGTTSADRLTPWSGGAETIFTNSASNPYALAYHNGTGVNYKVVTLGFEFSFINKADYRNELMFQVLRWFGQVENRIELKVTSDDMFFGQDNGPSIPFTSMHPVLGDSYILQSKIWNMGGTPGGAVVRFVDGTTVINSVNVYVPATTWDSSGNLIPGTAIAEVIWTPLFAGSRPITVKVDPDLNIPVSGNPRDTTGELFKFNNNASRTISINFFYDDMESGTTNWVHDATILHINGEQPIEYFDRLRPVDTNVISDFNWTAANTNNWTKDLTDGHTVPSSYKMNEPSDTNLTSVFNLKVAMCIDDSGSMQWNDATDIRIQAAQNFVKTILNRPGDQVAIYQFTSNIGNNPRDLEQFHGGGLYESYPFNNTINKYLNDTPGFGNNPGGVWYFQSNGGTPFYQCMQVALNQMGAWGQPNQYPVLIGLTDGQSNSGTTFRNFLPTARAGVGGGGVPIYTIGLSASVYAEQMYMTAEISNGGKYYYAANANVLTSIFARIGSDIGAGTSRDLPQEGTGSVDDGSGDYSTSGRADESRAVPNLQILNPAGGESWGQGIYRNITWACRATTQANCAAATLYINTGSGWQQIATPVGTALFFPDMDGDAIPEAWNFYSSVTSNWYPSNNAGGLVGWDDGGAGANSRPECAVLNNCVFVYTYNWTVPKVVANNAQVRVSVNDGGITSSDSGVFSIFKMGVVFASNKNGEIYNLTTQEFLLTNYQKATLKFWQRYDLLYTENGGVIQIGTATTKNGAYKYKYAQPTQPYTGNLRLDKTVRDNYVNVIRWAWNGRSGGGTYTWENVELDLTPYIDVARPWVRVRFSFYTWGYGNGGDWAIDDVTVLGTRSDATAITANVADQWQYYQWINGVDPAALQPHSGTHMWWNHNPTSAHDLKSGIDNSLMTKAINLLDAKDATLSVYFLFNVKDTAGRPPNGFRVEISSDNGVTWNPVNLGVRASWGVSGHWTVDGKSPDLTQAYTGIQDSGVDSATPVWVKAGSLWRLNTNLTGWTGQVIQIRFRVVTNLDPTHYQSNTVFKGIAIDDVSVRGNSTLAGAPMIRHDTSNDWLIPEGQVGHDGAQQEKTTKITAHDAATTLALPTTISKNDEGDI